MSSYLIWIISIVIALVYYKSSIQKLLNPLVFKKIISDYNLLKSDHLQLHVSLLITSLELTIAVFILFPSTRLISVLAGTLLQIIFIIALSRNLGKTFDNGCGCFQMNTPQTISMKSIYVNILLLVALCFDAYLILQR